MRRFLLALLISLSAIAALGSTMARAFDPFQQAGIDQRPGVLLPMSTTFIDEAGRAANLKSAAAGRPMLLVPVLHRCPNICGVTLSGLMEAVRAQSYKPGKDFAVVAMSIDPTETPGDARQSMEELCKRYPDLAAAVHAWTGSGQAIAAVTGALGYRYAWDEQIGQYAHISATAVVTPSGHLSRWLYGLAPVPDDLNLALTEAGQGQLGSWGQQLLLLCYHYDPTTGRYSPIVWNALRVGASVTIASLAGFLGLAFLRERRRNAVDRDG
ncbi:protein SCO1/2 [Rhizobium binae]|uniref:Protein SCO1/2 n=2 Tax=Rhizobium binae TaxID=1138190 RepID=A0ABV2MPQ6_9HYPH|nr:SCO family protein [Rhizobium binae]MBX4994921.1 SCO family protein [Rhizobium binae]NKL52539.1 SCO family protein [Rhizobium leguminosarum bv. viciae]QSY85009.1 SCO family protein [Rhizobium binae]